MSTVPGRYEGLADWYDRVTRDPLDRGPLAASAHGTLAELLGKGSGVIVDIGCGTGLAADEVRRIGYRPLGIDLARDQLRLASQRLPVVQGDARQLPLASGRIDAAYSTFLSSDLDVFDLSISEVYRMLRPGGRYVSVGVHPCLSGSHSELREDGAVVVLRGYAETGYRSPLQFNSTIRARVGAWHRPLAETINVFLEAGFRLERLVDGGPLPLPSMLGIRVEKP